MTIAEAIAGPMVLGSPMAEKLEPAVVKQWFADQGDGNLRVTYPLMEKSIVLDVGGYEGNWAAQIFERYGCTVHIFEPVPAFAAVIEQRFAGTAKIQVHRCGLAAQTGASTIMIDQDASSVHRAKGTACAIQLRSAAEVFSELFPGKEINLIKINIEGCEYELLEHLMMTGLIRQLRDIQVQFHDFVPQAAKRMADIQGRLARTHALSWQYRFVWENWRRLENQP